MATLLRGCWRPRSCRVRYLTRPPRPQALSSSSKRLATQRRSVSSGGAASYKRFPYNVASVLAVTVGLSLLYFVLKRRRKRGGSQEGGEPFNVEGEKLSKFRGKVVLITGAAGDIGGATASAFARGGATVILVDLPFTEERLAKKCSELEALGAPRALHVTADVTKVEDVQSMVKFTVDNAGGIDYFFNNAGIQGELRPLLEQSEESFAKVLNVNVYGVFLGLKHVSKAMKESGCAGVIVNTASVAGLLGPANMAAYAASKFAVVGLTKTAAKDLGPYGIRVVAIAPGILQGKMWHSQVKGNAECRKRLLEGGGDGGEEVVVVSEEEIAAQERRMVDGTPLKRLGRLEEVATTVTFLCSEEASYISGVTLPIDGGRIP